VESEKLRHIVFFASDIGINGVPGRTAKPLLRACSNTKKGIKDFP
jgi:hypothetical protein